jgi:hypothetical protein
MASRTVTATFNGSTDTVSVTYARTVATVPTVIAGDPIMSNPGDPFVVVCIAGAPTSTGCTVQATAAFTGSVNLLVLD